MGVLKMLRKSNIFLAVFALGLFLLGGVLLFSINVYAEGQEAKSLGSNAGWGFIAAALAVGFSSLGAGIAVSGVGSAAMGAVSERPELMGRTLIYVGLAEGIAIYGLIVSIMILARI
ncbi:MAG: hypothetical protein B6D56_04345 [Candidatus Omnitrophica bacterium 4484_70.1]|nr:MAG: hypothetical protein B6D56_04345 [Candidatus Omnitrophica bacterium 4484_70.1]